MNSLYTNGDTSIIDIRNETSLIVGQRGTGESYFILYIYETLDNIEQFDQVYIVAPKEEMIPFYSTYIPDATIVFALTNEIVDDLCTLSPNSLVILDDCYHRRLQPTIRSLAILYAQNRVTFIMTQMWHVSFAEFDNIFLGKESTVNVMNRIYNSIYNLQIPPEEPFDEFLNFRLCMESMPLYSFMYVHHIPIHRFISRILRI